MREKSHDSRNVPLAPALLIAKCTGPYSFLLILSDLYTRAAISRSGAVAPVQFE
jgi:hypothetical protein